MRGGMVVLDEIRNADGRLVLGSGREITESSLQ